MREEWGRAGDSEGGRRERRECYFKSPLSPAVTQLTTTHYPQPYLPHPHNHTPTVTPPITTHYPQPHPHCHASHQTHNTNIQQNIIKFREASEATVVIHSENILSRQASLFGLSCQKQATFKGLRKQMTATHYLMHVSILGSLHKEDGASPDYNPLQR